MKFIFGFLLILGCYAPQNILAQTQCELPAPETLIITDRTPVHVEIEWGAVSGAWGYYIELKEDNYPVVSQDVGANVNTAAFTLHPNAVSQVVTVYPKCGANSVSVNSISKVVPVFVVVVDLLPSQSELPAESALQSIYSYQDELPNGSTVPTGQLLAPYETYYYKFSTLTSTLPIWGKLYVASSINRVNIQPIVNSATGSWVLSGIEPEMNYFLIGRLMDGAAQFPARLDISFDHAALGLIQAPKLKLMASSSGNSSGISNFTLYTIKTIKFHSDETSSTAIPPIAAPNPFSDHLNVLLGDTPTAPVTVKMFDITGQLQKTTQMLPSDMSSRSFSVETSELPAGVYVVQIDNGASGLSTFKLIKI